MFLNFFFFFKQKTAYEMRISDWSSDVCSSDLTTVEAHALFPERSLARGRDEPAAAEDLSTVRERAEREHIRKVLGQTGQLGRAASILGISRTTLWEKMRRFGIGCDD